jgi:hypothetical protein
MIDVQLTATGFQLQLAVDGYEFPEFDTGRDGNALAGEIELDLDRGPDLHAAHRQLILYTFELADFVDQLHTLANADHGHATLGDPDPESGDPFGLRLELDHDTGTLEGFLADHTTRITFELITIDRAIVRDLLAQLAAVIETYPVRGDPTAD